MNKYLSFLSVFVALALPANLNAQVTLAIDPIVESGTANFHISQGIPDAWVILCYSLNGPGPTTLPGGPVLDLSVPIKQLDPFRVKNSGNVDYGPLAVPPSITAGTRVWFQGVQISFSAAPLIDISNMVVVTVQAVPPPPRPDMAYIPGGTFGMGDHFDIGLPEERPVHFVALDSFYIDQYEVSNQKFADYLNSEHSQGNIMVSNSRVHQVGGGGFILCNTNPVTGDSKILWDGVTFTVVGGSEQWPVVEVSWYGSCLFANWQSSEDNLNRCYDINTFDCDFGANGYRLPTEAEWEYAARGGAHNPYYRYPWNRNDATSNDLNWLYSGYHGPVDVGQYAPNGYGLYDTAGNVWEWCHDWGDWNYYSNSPGSNPTGPASGSNRIRRG